MDIITVDQRALKPLQEKLAHIAGGFDKAAERATNRAIVKTRTIAVKAMAQRYTVKQADARQAITTRRAYAKVGRMEGRVISRGHRLSLMRYDVEPKTLAARRRYAAQGQSARLVKVKVLRGGSQKPLAHAFVAFAPGGSIQVFQRAMQGGRRVGRLPVEVLRGPSPPVQTRKIVPAAAPEIRAHYLDRIRHEAKRMLTTGR